MKYSLNLISGFIITILIISVSCEKEGKNFEIADKEFEIIDSLVKMSNTYLKEQSEYALKLALEALARASSADYERGKATSSKVIGRHYFNTGNLDSAAYYYHKCLFLFKKLNETGHTADTYIDIGVLHITSGSPDSADIYFNKSLDVVDKEDNIGIYARALYNYGDLYFRTGDYYNAMKKQLDAYRIAELHEDTTILIVASGNIGNIYYAQENYDEALQYHSKSLELKQKTGDKRGVATSLNNLAAINYINDNYDEAINLFLQAASINTELRNLNSLAGNYNNIGLVYNYMEESEDALRYYLKAKEIITQTEAFNMMPALLNNIGLMYKNLGEAEEALYYLNNALKFSLKTDNKSVRKDVLNNFYQVYEGLGNYKEALKYHLQFYQLSDSLISESLQYQISELKIAFDVEQKENEIELLSFERELHLLQIRQSRYLLIGLISGIILLSVIIISFIILRNRKIMQKKVLKKVVEVEESERKRFASDLHDSLGPVLSAAKMCLGALENAEEHERMKISGNAIEMVDSGIKSMRTIANNLMPAEIEQHGLLKSLQNFAGKVSQSKEIDIQFAGNSDFKRFDATIEVVLYRVVCELINNTIKHAEADNITISFKQIGRSFWIEYKDNGKGFEIGSDDVASSGIGLKSLFYRIKSINGNLTISSKPNKGMKANIELIV